MKKVIPSIFICAIIFIGSISSSQAANKIALFDVSARKAELQKPEFAQIRELCMAKDTKQPQDKIFKPVEGLKETDGYGTDRSLTDFTWFLMIHSGRTLAGDTKSYELIKQSLITWSAANALYKTQEVHDAYYALKRGLLPIIISYTIIKDDLSSHERKQIETWLTHLVKKIDHLFGGDVDHNNHRYLADSVLALWGDIIGNKALYKKGRERFEIALKQMHTDGSLPLETRRGSRALWYTRQAIADLTLIAEVYHNNNDDLFGMNINDRSLPLLMNYFISSVQNPLVNLEYSSENYIPGPSNYFPDQDMGMLQTRGGKRHYMAFAHIYTKRYPDNFSAIRLQNLMDKTGYQELPLIDDFMGGNTTCFWGQP